MHKWFGSHRFGNANFSCVEPGGFLKISVIKIAASILCLNLVACASAEVISGPDGTPHQLVTCADIKGCYEKAAEVCGGKYQIVNTSNEVSGDAKGTSSTTKLLVKCQK